MKIEEGQGKTEYGTGILIKLTKDEVATAIDNFILKNGVTIHGPRTVIKDGSVYVDPSGFVIDNNGMQISGGSGRYELSMDEIAKKFKIPSDKIKIKD